MNVTYLSQVNNFLAFRHRETPELWWTMRPFKHLLMNFREFVIMKYLNKNTINNLANGVIGRKIKYFDTEVYLKWQMSFNFSRTTEARGNRVREGDRSIKRSCENNSKYSSHYCALINARKNENFFRKCHHHDSWVAPIYHHHSHIHKTKTTNDNRGTQVVSGERGSGGAKAWASFHGIYIRQTYNSDGEATE